MPATEAQIAANRANAALAKGPVTEQGKARSRMNSLKHGLTGAGVVLPEADAAEVERVARAFQGELKAPGEVGKELARRMALHAVRLRRCEAVETAALSDRVVEAAEAAEVPEGATPEEEAKIRTHAAHLALFDPSPEAIRLRKYEAAAERGFFRAHKEIEALKRTPEGGRARVVADETRSSLAKLGPFSPGQAPARPAPTPAAPTTPAASSTIVFAPPKVPTPPRSPSPVAFTEVPIAIGRVQ